MLGKTHAISSLARPLMRERIEKRARWQIIKGLPGKARAEGVANGTFLTHKMVDMGGAQPRHMSLSYAHSFWGRKG